MTPFEAQQNEKREREAARHGLTLAQYEMSQAVGTRLMQDIVRDNRGIAGGFPIDPAPRTATVADFPEDLKEVIYQAHGNPYRCPSHVIREAQRLLAEGNTVGAAAITIWKRFRDQL